MIQSYRFGELVTDKATYTKDLKILSDKTVVHPWWRSQGHLVVVQDVEDLLREEPQTLILGKGDPGRMSPDRELVDKLQKEGVRLVDLPTREAVQEYNAARERGEKVCAGFHLTC